MGIFPKEWAKRVKPEGLAVSTAIALLAYGLFPLQAGLNVALYEHLSGLPPEQLQLMAVGVFALANIATSLIGAAVIKKHGYCADIHTNVPVVGLGLWRGVVAGTLFNIIYGTVVNPNDLVAWGNLLTSTFVGVGDRSLAGINIISKSFLVTMYQSGFNAAIILGGGAMMATASERIRDKFSRRKNII